jgi:hypothetical protein
MERLRVLHGHTSPETAYVVPDYPYGFTLRCKIRYWIETATKGAGRGKQRFVSQTTNPKRYGEVWNKPKASTYSLMAFMYLDAEGLVQWTGMSEYHGPVGEARWALNGVRDQMLPDQRERYDVLMARFRKYNPNTWAAFAAKVAAIADYGKGIDLVNNVWTSPDGSRMYLEDPEVYTLMARAMHARCQLDIETDEGPYPCHAVRPCRRHEGPALEEES